ncbi:MAG: thioredoxin family protein [Planctomycetota bacterium]|jgi:thiol-disulfide isomerase/thioredoxin
MYKAEKHESKDKGKSSFHSEIKDMNKAFVLFYASWCQFCKQFLPIFEEYSKSNPKDCLSVLIDEKPDVCREYSIEYYPTVILFKKGKVHKRLDARPGIGLNKKQLKDLTENQ